jgi:hypothetical protein
MTQNEHILLLLSEECDEVSQRVIKALRFGLDEVQPEQPLNNTERIVYELNDLMAVIELLQEINALPLNLFNRETIQAKKKKVVKYLDYAISQGTIQQKSPQTESKGS